MMQAVFSAVSGLRNNDSWLDVLGNNIANLNTTGFKGDRVIFQDVLSRTIRGASAPVEDGPGGTNPVQIGLGTSLAGVETLHTQGNISYTGNPNDIAIRGNGFFVLSNGVTTSYTRDGTFGLGLDRTLMNLTNGMKVQGWLADASGGIDTEADTADLTLPENLISYSVGPTGIITGLFDDGPRTLGQIALAAFENPSGLSKVGGNAYQETVNSGEPAIGEPATEGRGEISAGFLEMSNVDLAEQFTGMIMAQRGFQANTKVIRSWDQMLSELVNLIQ